MDVMTYCHVEETRRRCWEGVSSPGTARAVDNEPLLRRAMELRQEQAELLGYRHFADMQAARSMMGTAEKALAFVDQLMAAYKPAFDAEVAEYLAALSRVKGERITRIEPWNELYYAKDIPADGEDFQIEQLSPYFQGEHVIGGMLRLWEKLLGIRITEQKVQDKLLDFTNFDENGRNHLRERIHVVINAPRMFAIPDELKVKGAEEKDKEAIDKAIQETIQELTVSAKDSSRENEAKQASDAIDQYNASLPQMTVV
jgi:hypothetical protein